MAFYWWKAPDAVHVYAEAVHVDPEAVHGDPDAVYVDPGNEHVWALTGDGINNNIYVYVFY